jgi:ankyrin repeat domain-containing protein 50
MGSLLVSIEKVTYLTNRCTIYESLYRPGTTAEQVLHNLHAALVTLYAAILRLMALAHRLFDKNTATRTMHALVNPSQVSDLLAKCQDLETRVEIEAQNCERMRSQEADTRTQELLKSLRAPILRTDERVSSLLEKVDDEERLKILDWISKVLYGKNHDTVTEQRTKDTCEWLLRHNRYLEWQDTSSSMILWLHGTGRFSMFTYVEECFVAD